MTAASNKFLRRYYAQVRDYLSTLDNLTPVDMDSTGLKNLKETILQLTKENTRIVLSGVSEPVKKDLLKGGIGELVGVGNIYPKFDMALSAAKEMVENN